MFIKLIELLFNSVINSSLDSVCRVYREAWGVSWCPRSRSQLVPAWPRSCPRTGRPLWACRLHRPAAAGSPLLSSPLLSSAVLLPPGPGPCPPQPGPRAPVPPGYSRTGGGRRGDSRPRDAQRITRADPKTNVNSTPSGAFTDGPPAGNILQ